MLSTHRIEAEVSQEGNILLEQLPFLPGQRVEVVIRSRDESPRCRKSLEGTVLQFENPFTPVADSQWSATS
jgi:hypothetical protein